jgi:two-component system, chemotaxis family, protein-glutamate methylesterase/glutaminase
MSELTQLVVFRLDEVRYALRLTVVERIVRAAQVTPLPNAPTIVFGVIDLEGRVLPVLNIAHGFLPGLVEWLNQTTGLPVHVASQGTCPLRGHAYLAPDDFHMGVSASGRILLTQEEPENGLRPAVAHLLRSLAEVCGRHAPGVLLSGMGKDGAAELKLMKDKGAITIAQDRESSIVHGMPGEAIELGGATHVLAADNIADTLITLVGVA